MKKMFVIVLLLAFISLLYGCDMEFSLREPTKSADIPTHPTVIPTNPVEVTDPTLTDYTDYLVSMMSDFIDRFPTVINSSFEFPSYEGVTITVKHDDQEHRHAYHYQSPFYDQIIELDIEMKRGSSIVTDQISISLLSLDSGRNNNRMDIYTTTPIDQIQRGIYVDAHIVVEGDVNGVYQTQHADQQARIRGRGNSTWWLFPKKPFRINFSEDVSIYGMPASKSYVLLAEYSDKSLMRNVVTHKLSSLLSHIHYVVQTRYVDIYVNDEYQGVYVLAEQIQIREEKLFFESIPGVFDTGFLIELDQRFYEQNEVDGYDWVLIQGQPYSIKSPDPEHRNFTTVHHDYIFEYLTATRIALEQKQGYEDLIDVDNWIDYFIIQEFVKNVDVGWSSVYMYKEPQGKLTFGPLWDFDLAYGNANYIDYGPANWYGMRQYKNHFFRLMMDIPAIRVQFRDRLLEVIDLYIPEIISMIHVLHESIRTRADENFQRWEILNQYVWPNPYEIQIARTYEGQILALITFINQRANWLSQAVLTESYNLGYFD